MYYLESLRGGEWIYTRLSLIRLLSTKTGKTDIYYFIESSIESTNFPGRFLKTDRVPELHTLKWYLFRLPKLATFDEYEYSKENTRLVHAKTGEKIPLAIL